MANHKAGLTTVNVKNVSEAEWERAKQCANRSGELIGEWLTRAIRMLADREESGPREFGPAEPARARTPVAWADVAALLQGVAATGSSRTQAALELRALAAEIAREARGLEPLPARLPPANLGAKLTRISGQTPLIEQVAGT